jgi:hypothetical protein
MSQNNKKDEKDPFFALKYIAYHRTGLPKDSEEIDPETLISFAKWQICKVRNILWNDPIWDSYTEEEILIEFFAIKFDESEDLRKEFGDLMIGPSKKDLDWFEQMEQAYVTEKQGTIEEDPKLEPEEFEDTFG